MIIDIEVIIIVAVSIVLTIGFTWFKITSYLNKKRYKPENDKGRDKTEDKKGSGRESKFGETSKTVISISGLREPEEPGVLQTAEIVVDGETSNSDGKVSRQFINPFRRRTTKSN